MNDNDYDISKIISLKRYETPPEGFIDDLLVKLHERQRAELLHQSALDLAWERLVTYVQHWSTPQWALASATALMMMMAVAVAARSGQSSMVNRTVIPEGDQISVRYSHPVEVENSPILMDVSKSGTRAPIRESDVLLGNHFKGGIANGNDALRLTKPESIPHAPMMISPMIRLGPEPGN
jgi:hypothetical protein